MGRSRRSYELIMKFWKFGHIFDNWPIIGNKSSDKTTAAHIIPINQPVHAGQNMVLPMQVLQPLIERVNGVAIMNECMCRRGQNCVTYPHNFGCLLLGGDAIADIHPSLARKVTPTDAIAHTKRAIRMGLVPLVIHDAVDAWIWGVDFHNMMNVCFCCDCCCDVRIGIRKQVQGFYANIHRLPGLTVSVGEGCISCGTCVEVCLAHAIQMTDGGARIGESCKGCGRCVTMCPQQAITMAFDPRVDTIKETLSKYEGRTRVWKS